MRHSALNQQQSQLKNHGLYFLLGLLSTSQRLQSQLSSLPIGALPEDTSENQNDDFLYLCLGLLSFSQDLQARLKLEYDRTTLNDLSSTQQNPDALSGALY